MTTRNLQGCLGMGRADRRSALSAASSVLRGCPRRSPACSARRSWKGELKPGDRLPTEFRLSESYGVSRTVIREAVARLRSDGVVETRHGIGAFVVEPRHGSALRIDPESLADKHRFAQLFEVRALLEIEAAAIAAVRRTPDQLDAILSAHRRLEQARGGSGAMVEADLDFHRAVGRASGNGYLPVLIDFLSRQLRESILASWVGGDGLGAHDLTVAEHSAIVWAIKRRDVAAARTAAAAHLHMAAGRLGLELPMPTRDDRAG